MTFSIGRKLQCGENVLAFQIGYLVDDLLYGHSRAEIVEDVLDRDTQPTNAWLAPHLSRLNCDSLEMIHKAS
jgi:hypothetical protein